VYMSEFINDNIRYKEVLEWATDKGILKNGTKSAQAFKTLEESGELIAAIATGYQDEVDDALGDIFVTIIIQAELQGVRLDDCLIRATNVITRRTGEMINGSFVKDPT